MNADRQQFTTFTVGEELFGIEVLKIQEVTGEPTVFPVPLAPPFIRGLINLRGQIATAIGLKELLTGEVNCRSSLMSVVCKVDGNLVSILVDTIGDVIEVDGSACERLPDNMPSRYQKYIKGICKLHDRLMSVVDLETIAKELSPNADAA